jgi:hypothetical protein
MQIVTKARLNMQFQQLERTKSNHPRLRPLLEALETYICREVDGGRTRIVPALAARALNKSEAETLALLMLFEDSGVLTHEYDIVCKRNNAVLKTVTDKSKLEDALRVGVPCQLCDLEHGPDDLRTELVFEVTSAAVQAFRQHAFA